MVLYDRIGARYVATRRPDPRIAAQFHAFWLLREYVPEAARISQTQYVAVDRLVELLGGAREPYLDPTVGAGIAMLAYAGDAALAEGLARLAGDLRSGHWHRRHSDLLEQQQFDAGERLLISEQGQDAS